MAWGDIVNGVAQYDLHKYQQRVLQSRAKITFAIAGSGGGKTALIPLWLLLQVKRNPTGTYLVVSPDYKLFGRGLKRHLLAVFRGLGEWKEQEKCFVLSTGGRIFVASAVYADSLESIHPDAIAADEVAQFSETIWEFILRRSFHHNCPILGVTTPNVGNAWINREVVKRWHDGDPDYNVIRWASVENPSYDRDAWERAKRTLSPALFSRMHEGQDAALDGLVYEQFAQCILTTSNHLPPDALPSPAIKVIGGLDWGYSKDQLAFPVIPICQDGRAYVVEELYERRLDLDTAAQKIQRLCQKWNIEQIYCDSSRPESASMLRKLGGLPIQNRRVVDIETGVAMVNARINRGLLAIYDCAQNLLAEFGSYQREKNEQGEYTKIIGGRDHALDALRYALSSYDYGKQLPLGPSLPAVAPTALPSKAQVEIRLGRIKTPDEWAMREQQERERQRTEWMLSGLDDSWDQSIWHPIH